MNTSNIRIYGDLFDTSTGKYTCMIYFSNDIDETQKNMFIKKHITTLNYDTINFVFNPSLGSKATASRHAENKNQVKLEVQFIKLDINVKFEKPKPQSCLSRSNCELKFPTKSPENIPTPYKSNIRYMSVSNLQDAMWIKELQQHPEYATLNSHPHYSSFKHAILICSTEQEKENTYKFYCDNL
jgi:hypothetical protein